MPDGIGATLTEDAGPLPVWAWGGLGIAGLAVYLVIHKKNQATAAAQPTQGVAQTDLGTTPVSNLTTDAQPMPIQMGDTFVDVSPAPAPDVTQTVGPVTVNNPPPAAAPPPPKAPPPAPPKKLPPPPPKAPTLPPAPKPAPPKPPAPVRTYVIKAGDTLWGIAQRYYGNGALWTQIYNANKAKIGANPNLIHPGTVLTIP